jgi:hypothetical protein
VSANSLWPAWLLALIAGFAGGAFRLAIAMFNLRTRTTAGSAAIADFAMGIGYSPARVDPCLGGLLNATTGSWATPLWVYAGTVGPLASGGVIMARPGRYLEDEYAGSLAGAPVFIGSSDVDPHVPLERIQESTAALGRMGPSVDERIYPGMGHTINADELAAVHAMLRERR